MRHVFLVIKGYHIFNEVLRFAEGRKQGVKKQFLWRRKERKIKMRGTMPCLYADDDDTSF